MIPEYIDREKVVESIDRVIANLRKSARTNLENRAIDLVQYTRDYLSKIPAADVAPVVRCQECRHYKEIRTKKYGNPICRCTRMGKYDMDYPVRPYDFCSYGEKTDNSTEK